MPKQFSYQTFSTIPFCWSQRFCSHAGVKSSDREDELEDGFSDLEIPPETNNIAKAVEGEVNDYVSAGEISDGEAEITTGNSLGLSDTELDPSEVKASGKSSTSPLLKILTETPRQSLISALDKWVEEGNPIERAEISIAIVTLRKRRHYGKALQFVEWLEANKHIDFEERDYASHLDLVARVHGLQKAEQYIQKLPESARTEVVYSTLLANCVANTNIKKAEEVFSKMKSLDLPITSSTCNRMLLLYKRTERKKIADVLLLMEKQDIKPSLFTYKLLIDTKGRANDIAGMEKILETMKDEGIELDLMGKAMIAKHYIYGGCKDKAEAAVKEMKGDDIEENRAACRLLLPLYASLGKADDVARIWKACEANLRLDECFGAIEAWGKLGRVEDAEEVFEKMIKTWTRPSSKPYIAMLKVYVNHKLLTKGKELVKRMSDNGCRVGPLTWDVLVKLYLQSGEVEKADSILQKAAEQNQIRPLYITYSAVLDKYANRGDVHNAEKIFHKMKLIGYAPRLAQFQSLLQAYVKAKTPAYGFRERMKADNMFPNKLVSSHLAAIDAFKKTPISELLD